MDKEQFEKFMAAIMTQNLLLEKLYRKLSGSEKADDESLALAHVKLVYLRMKNHAQKGEFDQ